MCVVTLSTCELGEDPLGVPYNVMPYLAQIAIGRLSELSVFGDDYYGTPDGTCIREYIHVVDVADAHRVALEHLDDVSGFRVFNLGTGSGVSVLQLVAAFFDACGKEIPYRIVGRRPGDVPKLIADPALVGREWGRTRRDTPPEGGYGVPRSRLARLSSRSVRR